jgi:hypothetical protein
MTVLKAFYTTVELKLRYNIKATRTLKEWRKKRGMPKPMPFSQGGNLYSKEAIHAWENEGGMNLMVA